MALSEVCRYVKGFSGRVGTECGGYFGSGLVVVFWEGGGGVFHVFVGMDVGYAL